MAPRPGSTLPDLSPLKIDDRARTSGGRRKFLPWFAAVLGAVLLVLALVVVLQRQAPLVEVAVGAHDRGRRPGGASERQRLRDAAPARHGRRQDHRAVSPR